MTFFNSSTDTQHKFSRCCLVPHRWRCISLTYPNVLQGARARPTLLVALISFKFPVRTSKPAPRVTLPLRVPCFWLVAMFLRVSDEFGLYCARGRTFMRASEQAGHVGYTFLPTASSSSSYVKRNVTVCFLRGRIKLLSRKQGQKQWNAQNKNACVKAQKVAQGALNFPSCLPPCWHFHAALVWNSVSLNSRRGRLQPIQRH